MKFEDMKYIHSKRGEACPDEAEYSGDPGPNVPGPDDGKKKRTRNRSGDTGKQDGTADGI